MAHKHPSLQSLAHFATSLIKHRNARNSARPASHNTLCDQHEPNTSIKDFKILSLWVYKSNETLMLPRYSQSSHPLPTSGARSKRVVRRARSLKKSLLCISRYWPSPWLQTSAVPIIGTPSTVTSVFDQHTRSRNVQLSHGRSGLLWSKEGKTT